MTKHHRPFVLRFLFLSVCLDTSLFSLILSSAVNIVAKHLDFLTLLFHLHVLLFWSCLYSYLCCFSSPYFQPFFSLLYFLFVRTLISASSISIIPSSISWLFTPFSRHSPIPRLLLSSLALSLPPRQTSPYKPSRHNSHYYTLLCVFTREAINTPWWGIVGGGGQVVCTKKSKLERSLRNFSPFSLSLPRLPLKHLEE